MKFYDFEAKKMNGKKVSMKDYEGKVTVVVNTATKCGFTPQLDGLEKLYEKHQGKGFAVLGFPCNQFMNQDPGSNEEIHTACKLNYGVTFDMFEKIEVNGPNTHPIYKYLKDGSKGLFGNKIKWNFTKFLLDSNGNVVKRYAPTVKPEDMEKDILDLLKK